MNVREYIRSGAIESYVLGIATEAERQEFEQVCAAYPEVAEARDAFERSLEEQLLQDATPPPVFIREKLLQAVSPAHTENAYAEEIEQTPVRRLNPWKWIAAACFVLLAVTSYLAYTSTEKYNALAARQASLQQQLQQTTAQLQTLQQDAALLQKPGMRAVSLKGTQDAPQAQTTVYWDTTGTSKDVYLLVNNLPQVPTDKQYQLWALLDGKPIDLGVFDYDVKQQRLLVRMKNVQNAQAFAITLEEKGGKPAPEGPIYVVGNL